MIGSGDVIGSISHCRRCHFSFYRLVLEAEPQFSASGALQGPSARFTGLPGEPILTQHYHVPDNWMVEAVVSPYDLDNIKLDDVENGVHR